MDEGLSYDYRRKREIVIAEAPSLEDSVLAHISPGFISVQQMQDEELLDTQGTSKIRTTVYRTKPEKVNWEGVDHDNMLRWTGGDGQLCPRHCQGHPGHQRCGACSGQGQSQTPTLQH